MPDALRTTPATYRAVFARREFRVLFTITVLYVLGFQFEILALAVLVYARTGSGFWTALAFGVGFVPQALGGLLLTSLADRIPPRPLATAGLALRSAPGLIIGLAPTLPIIGMLVLVAAAAVITPVFNAATAAVLPDLLAGDEYVLGRSVFGLVGSGMQILGLALGGAVLALLAPRELLLLAGAALLAAGGVARLGLRPRPARAAARPGSGVLRASLAGHAALLADPRIRGLLLIQWLPACLVAGAESLLVPYAAAASGSPGRAGGLLAALPFGMLAGDLLVGRYCAPATRERLSLPLATLLGIPLLCFALHPPLAVAIVLLSVAGFGFSYTLGLQRRFLAAVPERLRGQAFGLMSTGMMGGQGMTPPAAGALATQFGAAAVIAFLGAATAATPWLLGRPLRD